MSGHAISHERLAHFQCGECRKWWSIGDAPSGRRWHCPWCGTCLPERLVVVSPVRPWEAGDYELEWRAP